MLLAVCSRIDAFAKVNKYAKFSKADEVRKSLRFSNIDDADGDSSAPAPKPAAPPPPPRRPAPQSDPRSEHPEREGTPFERAREAEQRAREAEEDKDVFGTIPL